MILNDKNTSLLVAEQLPQFVRDNPDYSNFTLFLEAYYEWLETSNAANSISTTAHSSGQGVTFAGKNLLNYKDIDNTIDDFIEYFNNDFLPNFPKDSLINKDQAVKVARQLYQLKGTPASYKFLFKILYNSDFEYFYTKDAVLKPSDGIWYVAKSLKLSTQDVNFRNINTLRLFGETSQSIATVENAVLAGNKTEVFISNIERLFESGEFVRVVDSNNQDVLFNGQPLRAKIVGQVSQVNIDPNHRGLLYRPGDPVIVYGGLATEAGVGAIASVANTTSGSIKSIGVIDGGYGYTAFPQTIIDIQSNGVGANAVVASLNPLATKTANVTFLPSVSLGQAWSTHVNATHYAFLIDHPSSDKDTTLANGLSFLSYTTYPIGSVIVTNGGGGITEIPQITASSYYSTDYHPSPEADLSTIGILAPIQVVNGGHGYRANDTVTIIGGSGYGAKANVTNVAANGAILKVTYVASTGSIYPLGGMGYKESDILTTTIHSSNTQAGGAVLSVPGILGAGAEFSVVVDRAGSVTSIRVDEPGEDYVSAPEVSLKVQDIVVSNVSIFNLPKLGDTIYQGANVNVSTYQATVNSVSLLQPFNDPSKSLYNLRVFNYNSNPDPTKQLNIDKTINVHLDMYGAKYNSSYDKNGVKTYGDGAALATSKFLNGLVVSQGQYLNSQGQLSSFSVLQDENYNNYTYEITVAKEIEKYRSVLLNLLHPSGMKIIGRMADTTTTQYTQRLQNALYSGRPLYSPVGGIGASGATATIETNFTNKSNNIVKFHNLAGANIANIIFANTTTLNLSPINGPDVSALVVKVNYTNNTVTLQSNTWLTFGNVATVTGNSGSNTLNISGLTGAYDIINNGFYSNTSYPLMDIVYNGDKVLVNNEILTVEYVDYISGNGIIYLTTNLSSNANTLLSVNRTYVANSSLAFDEIKLYGPVGTTYIPELTTESGLSLTTEDGRIILLG
jgi:hypothetical protein